MTYKEQYNIPYLMNGHHYIYDNQEDEDTITIYVQSKPHNYRCPVCHQESDICHSTYERILQDIPIHRKKTFLQVKAYRCICINEQCKCNVFMEELPFALPSQVRTIPLNTLILGVSMFLSNDGASKVLALLGITVSNDTIKRMYDRIKYKDRANEEMVMIYDIKNHKSLTLVSGRGAVALKKYMEANKKIRIVDKEKTSIYAKAIEEILPEYTQKAEGVPLFQSLIEQLWDIFKLEMPTTLIDNEL